MCGSDLDVRTFGWSNYIWVFDNEPRNREIVSRIERCINRGDKVVIWPSHIQEKDVNEMILAKYDICTILESSTYSELTAKTKIKSLEEGMSNGTKVKKRDGSIEPLNLEKNAY